MTLVAEFKKARPIYNYQETVSSSTSKYYTVRFVANGGSKVKQQSVKSGERAVEPTREGYVFDGWYTNRQFVSKYDFSSKVSSNISVYAKWIEVKSYNNPFTDVSIEEWLYEAVKYVNSNGLMNGVTSTEFAPDDNLTRAMLVTILYRADGEPAVNKSIPFADVTADSY